MGLDFDRHFEASPFRPETTSRDFDLHVRMVKAKMQVLNGLLRAHGQFDVANGLFAVFTEMKVKDGRITGMSSHCLKTWTCTIRTKIETKDWCRRRYTSRRP